MAGETVIIAAVAAALPTLAYLALIWWLDRYEKEPMRLLAASFLWGALPAALLAVVLEVTLDLPLRAFGDAALKWREASLLTPFVEETVKGAALLGLVARVRHEFHGVLDGIVYGAVVGLGFAFTENLFAFMAAFSADGISIGLSVVSLRAGLFGLNHPLYSAVFGAGLGWTIFRPRRPWHVAVPLLCLGAAVGLHLLHNVLAAGAWAARWSVPLALLADWSGLALVAAIVVLTWRHEQRWIEEGLDEELARGSITNAEYLLVRSYPHRAAAEWRTLKRSGWGCYRALARHTQTLTKLAFARYHLRRGLLPPDRAARDVLLLEQAARAGRLALARQHILRAEPEEAKRA